MSSINVISINPAKSAKSALHPEVFERIARECRVNRDMTNMTLSAKKTINLFFGINKSISRRKSTTLLIARTVAGLALIAGAFYSGLGLSSFSASWGMLVLGISLISGLFSRFTSFIGAGFFGYMTYMSTLISGTPDVAIIFSAFLSLTFFISGPGMFSVDQILRRNLIRYAKVRSRIKAEKLAANRLSYRAMQYME